MEENAQSEFLTAQDKEYKYQNVRMPYRSEKIIISDKEKQTLQEWVTHDCTVKPRLFPKKIIFDTDIGTDIDDALALLMLLHFPQEDYELLGITTTYGHTHLRTEIVKKIVNDNVPVITGESTPLGTHRPVWHTETEGLGVLPEDEIEQLKKKSNFIVANNIPLSPIDDFEKAKQRSEHQAAVWIIEQVKKYPGDIAIVCLGALSNIAIALRLDPSIAPMIPRIVFTGVGGTLRLDHMPENCAQYNENVSFFYPTHNLCSDVLAAVEVFRSGIHIDIVNNPLTRKLWWGKPFGYEKEIEETTIACFELLEATSPNESVIVGKMLDKWLMYRSFIFRRLVRGTCPHDPLTVAEAVYPDRFITFKEGFLMVHEWGAFPTFVTKPGGPHRIGCEVEKDLFLRFLTKYLRPQTSNYQK